MATSDQAPDYIDRDFTVEKAPTIPPATYLARLDGISEIDATFDGKTSRKLRWHWVLPDKHPDGGDFRVSTFSALHLTESPKANFRKFVTALRGGVPPVAGENLNVREFYGKSAQLVVTLEDDQNKVEAVVAAPTPQAKPAANGAPALAQSVDPEFLEYLARKQAKAKAAAEQANAETAPDALPPPPAEAPADAA